jgi:hypothetical protein
VDVTKLMYRIVILLVAAVLLATFVVFRLYYISVTNAPSGVPQDSASEDSASEVSPTDTIIRYDQEELELALTGGATSTTYTEAELRDSLLGRQPTADSVQTYTEAEISAALNR